MAIEIVDLPSYKMVDLSIVKRKRLPEGQPPCSYGFPMVFLWFSYGFPMVLPLTKLLWLRDLLLSLRIAGLEPPDGTFGGMNFLGGDRGLGMESTCLRSSSDDPITWNTSYIHIQLSIHECMDNIHKFMIHPTNKNNYEIPMK